MQGLRFSDAKDLGAIRTVLAQTGTPNAGEIG